MANRFVPDLRNSGGRKAISDLMNKHYAQLKSAKPTLFFPKLELRSRSTVVRSVRTSESSRVASATRTMLDNSLPATFALRDKLSQNRGKKQKQEFQAHLDNIRHMNRRIQAIGSVRPTQMQERRKNPCDPLANPALLFQRGHEIENSSQAEARFRAKLLSPPKPSAIYSRGRSLQQRASTGEVREVDVPITPAVGTADPAPLQTLEKQLWDIITHYRVYQDQELEALFRRTREAHRHLAPALLDKAITRVQQRLDG